MFNLKCFTLFLVKVFCRILKLQIKYKVTDRVENVIIKHTKIELKLLVLLYIKHFYNCAFEKNSF